MLLLKLLTSVLIIIQPNDFSVIDGYGDTYTCWQNLMGAYTVGTDYISICEQGTFQTVLHEYWHYVFFNILNLRQRDAWYKICKWDTVSCGELFAEDFRKKALWITEECYEECDIREQFMEKVFLMK